MRTRTTHRPTQLAESLARSPLQTPRGTSRHALYIRGTGLTDWGAGVSVRFDEGRPVDLREHEGLRLWLRGSNEAITSAELDAISSGEP